VMGPYKNRLRVVAAAVLLPLGALAGLACAPAEAPANFEILELSGSHYQRGLQHGEHFSSKIRSFYTQMLTTSLLPYLNRERPDLSSVLWEYQDEIYNTGDFSYQLLLSSALKLEEEIPEPYIEEMRGIADGSGVDYKEILVLNTFMDSLLGIRAVSFFIRAMQSPVLERVAFSGSLGSDGIDNDGDGEADEADEGLLDPFSPSRYAHLVEVPVDTEITLFLEDDDGVDPESLRVLLDSDLFLPGDEALEVEVYGEAERGLEVRFRPPGGLQPARRYALQISAADRTWIADPPPTHARTMRDVRLTFTTAGSGATIAEVPNRGLLDGIYQPSAISFALRGSATRDGAPIVGHHFSMLDSNTSHKHSVLFVHRPDDGKDHAVLGWTGVISGFSGMNEDGLVFNATMSDTLDSPQVDEFRRNSISAELLSSGVPLSILGREMLSGLSTVAEAVSFLRPQPKTFGWNILLTDASGDMAAVEVDSDILDQPEGGFFAYDADPADPTNRDAHGNMLGSVGVDDLRMACHYQRNEDDIYLDLFGYEVEPQRTWSSFYFRSLRSFYALGEAIEERYGAIDVAAAQEILDLEILVDPRDSMNAAVFEPERRVLHFAMGQMPATSGPYVSYDLVAGSQL